MRRNQAVAGLVFERRLSGGTGALALIAALLCGALGFTLSEGTRSEAMRTGAGGTQVASSKTAARSRGAAVASAEDRLARVSDAVGAGDRSFWPRAEKRALVASGGGLHAVFTTAGASFATKEDTLGLDFSGLGGGRPPQRVSPQMQRHEVVYAYRGVSEFYRSGPAGIEQGFSVGRPARATSQLVLDLRASGALIPRAEGLGIVFERPGGSTSIRYGDLAAVDATGRRLAARIELAGRLVRLRVATADARYPVTIDPFIEKSKLRGANVSGLTGWSVALSENGSTALIGAPVADEEGGAVWVFTRSGSSWNQTATLTASGETGLGEFGSSVSLSADGNTALIGAPYDDERKGGVWVFTRTGSTWTQSGGVLRGGGEAGQALFGASVALSGDGEVAVVGGPQENAAKGAAWVFTRAGGTWTQAGEPLTGAGETSEGQFGYSVATSSSGDVALVGEPFENAAWAFTRSGSHWSDGTKIAEPGLGRGELAYFGWSVALSANGDIALVGAPHANASVGAGWVFTRSGRVWKQEGKKLIGTDKISHHEGGNEELVFGDFGDSVALAANGKTALVGGEGYKINEGAAWLFTWTGSMWKRAGRLQGKHETVEGNFGASLALAGNGKQALIGGPRDDNSRGGVWAFTKVSKHSRVRKARKRSPS